jgi:hypothetical protein
MTITINDSVKNDKEEYYEYSQKIEDVKNMQFNHREVEIELENGEKLNIYLSTYKKVKVEK